ncbi:MAG TPA: AAA family ATPase [Steroidobacteraceae bacterium]|jgi:general secretion pathway protein A|nr:AAA family ATPase [Steroidobacteraceae bacterium]
MYPQFFGLNKLPFRLRPDPDFLYPGQEYVRARGSLLAALRGGSRVVLFMGPPGTGKTLLLEDLLREISGQFALCRINQPQVSPTELLQAVLLQLGTTGGDADTKGAPTVLPQGPPLFTQLSSAIDAAAARHAVALIVIDDAQLLGGGTLNAFNDILARTRRLKILLIGRNDTRHGLATRVTGIEGSRQVRLAPFSAQESKAYIEHRLELAGGGGKELFTADAHAMIFQHTAGAARLINILCDAALHAACMRASGHVSPAEILVATQDSRWPDALARDNPEPAPAPDSVEVAHKSMTEPSQDRPAPYAQLLVMHGNEQLAALPLEAGCISIGRAVDNELRIDARYISRHHCRLVTVGNVSTIEDLGSVNGLLVNGQVAKSHVLQHADEIAVGEHMLKYVVN